MSWSNYHQHCYYCDGTSPLEEYVISALEKNVRSFGFSSHATIPYDVPWCIEEGKFSAYESEVLALREKYADQLPIFLGLEIDFFPNIMGPADERFKCLDYRIGSVHFAGTFEDGTLWGIDDTKKMYERGINEIFGGNVQAAVESYFDVTRQMIRQSPPDIIGHLDKIKMNNGAGVYFSEDEKWYQKTVLETLEEIAATDIVVEVNTRGVYKKKTAFPYPSPFILKHLLDMNVPIMLNSDAHHPREITNYFGESAEMLSQIGFKTLQIVTKNGLQARPFDKNGIKF
ncbi:MAG: histidinol-phosphatase [Chitinophagales bacterium]